MAVTQPIFKLEPPDFAWQQIQIISTDDNNNNNNNDNDDDKNNKNHKSFEASSVIYRFNHKIKQIQNLTVTTEMITEQVPKPKMALRLASWSLNLGTNQTYLCFKFSDYF